MGFYGISDSLYSIAGIQGVGEVPPHNHAATPVDDGRQIHMAVTHFDKGDINRPYLIRKGNYFIPQ